MDMVRHVDDRMGVVFPAVRIPISKLRQRVRQDEVPFLLSLGFWGSAMSLDYSIPFPGSS